MRIFESVCSPRTYDSWTRRDVLLDLLEAANELIAPQQPQTEDDGEAGEQRGTDAACVVRRGQRDSFMVLGDTHRWCCRGGCSKL